MKYADFPFGMRVVLAAAIILLGMNLLIFIPWLTALFAYEGWKKWQTLIAGLLALAGAAWTVWIINCQIKEMLNIEEDRRAREETASRAVLTLALDSVSQYARESIQLVARYAPAKGVKPSVPSDLQVPELSSEVLSVLRDCVRYKSDKAEQVATVLSRLQLQRARLRALIEEAKSAGIMERRWSKSIQVMYDSAELDALLYDLYRYGREGMKFWPVNDPGLIKNSLRTNGVREDSDPEIFNFIDVRYKPMPLADGTVGIPSESTD